MIFTMGGHISAWANPLTHQNSKSSSGRVNAGTSTFIAVDIRRPEKISFSGFILSPIHPLTSWPAP